MLKTLSFVLLLTFISSCHRTAVSDGTEVPTPDQSTEVITDVNTTPLDPNTPAAADKTTADTGCYDKSLAQPSMKCDEDRRPVCGCNGVTYKNACEAGKAGVLRYKWGPCFKTADR
ncbi:MAG: hypothetical protein IPN29_13400 [Saprospiraceae bacterium]|nr:hypothetical protein [Saprospiraceae bacterium]